MNLRDPLLPQSTVTGQRPSFVLDWPSSAAEQAIAISTLMPGTKGPLKRVDKTCP